MTEETERPHGSYARISIRLDPDRSQRLVREARTSAKSQSSILRNALDEHWALQDELAAPTGRTASSRPWPETSSNFRRKSWSRKVSRE